ncbi:MAG: hypothetical protein Q9227_001962 [Pyrenula ochraceoflavens]
MPDQSKYTNKLQGAHVLVIGGSSGLGYSAAEAAIEYGARVSISSSQQSRVDAAVDRLKKAYPSAASRITGYVCHLGDENTMEKNVESLFKSVGQLQHIIHTAGDRLAEVPIHDATLDKIKQAGMVRFFSPMIVAKFGSKYLSGGPQSSITLTTGAVSEKPIPNWALIGSYASGLQAMTRGLALDLKPIRVNLISPGGVDTALWDHMPAEYRAKRMEQMGKHTATGKIGQPEDVAEAYMYCLRDWNLTGSMISTNGGALLL